MPSIEQRLLSQRRWVFISPVPQLRCIWSKSVEEPVDIINNWVKKKRKQSNNSLQRLCFLFLELLSCSWIGTHNFWADFQSLKGDRLLHLYLSLKSNLGNWIYDPPLTKLFFCPGCRWGGRTGLGGHLANPLLSRGQGQAGSTGKREVIVTIFLVITTSIQAVFKKQIDVFVEEKLDFVLCEVCKTFLMVKQFRQIFIQQFFQYFEHIEETEWAIEECLKSNLPVRKKRNLLNLENNIILFQSIIMMDVWIFGFLPNIILNVQKCWGTSSKMCVNLPQVAATMCIGPEGDLHGNSAAECAIRMARAGQ